MTRPWRGYALFWTCGCRRQGLLDRDFNFAIVSHYWNPQQVERFLNSLADLGLRRARVAALIMWRAGLRVGETVALEWRDIDLTAGTLLVRRGKGGRGRTVPLHPDLASLFVNWPASYAPVASNLRSGIFRRQRKRGTRAERPSWVPGCSHTVREGWGGVSRSGVRR